MSKEPSAKRQALKAGDATRTPDGITAEVLAVYPDRIVVKLGASETVCIYPRGKLAGDEQREAPRAKRKGDS